MKNIVGSLQREKKASRTNISPIYFFFFFKPSQIADSSKADQLHAAHRLSTTGSEPQVSDKNKRNLKKNTEHSCAPTPPSLFFNYLLQKSRFVAERPREKERMYYPA